MSIRTASFLSRANAVRCERRISGVAGVHGSEQRQRSRALGSRHPSRRFGVLSRGARAPATRRTSGRRTVPHRRRADRAHPWVRGGGVASHGRARGGVSRGVGRAGRRVGALPATAPARLAAGTVNASFAHRRRWRQGGAGTECRARARRVRREVSRLIQEKELHCRRPRRSDFHRASGEAEPFNRGRFMYQKPQMERFGTFRELTQIGFNGSTDGFTICGIGTGNDLCGPERPCDRCGGLRCGSG